MGLALCKVAGMPLHGSHAQLDPGLITACEWERGRAPIRGQGLHPFALLTQAISLVQRGLRGGRQCLCVQRRTGHREEGPKEHAKGSQKHRIQGTCRLGAENMPALRFLTAVSG